MDATQDPRLEDPRLDGMPNEWVKLWNYFNADVEFVPNVAVARMAFDTCLRQHRELIAEYQRCWLELQKAQKNVGTALRILGMDV